jgi:monoglucosyldiacylglycerol epimerase
MEFAAPPSLGTLWWLGQQFVVAVVIFLCATVAFDVVHFLLHRCMRSSNAALRAIGSCHGWHHKFLDEQLQTHHNLFWQNMGYHLVPEFLTQFCAVGFFYFIYDWRVVACVHVFVLGAGIINLGYFRGQDWNHIPKPRHASQRDLLYISAHYHLMHHQHPDWYFSSVVSAFDRVAGTGSHIKGRRYVVTGAGGEFGRALCDWLEAHGAAHVTRLRFGGAHRDANTPPDAWTYDDISTTTSQLAAADVLVLAHGSKRDQAMEANCDSFVTFIETYKKLTLARQMPGEVWAVGSEIEFHPHFGNETLQIYSASKRAFAAHARRYYRDPELVYRHIVPSAFTSRMGPGLISANTAVRIAMFFITRGFRYVPVTYTGIAILNLFKFVLPLRTAQAPVNAASASAGSLLPAA